VKVAIALLVVAGCRPAPPRPEASDIRIDIPKLRIDPTVYGVPIAGNVELEVHVSAPPQDLRKANGTIAITCEPCEIAGASSPAFAGGVPVGRIRLGRVDVVIDVAGGLAALTRFRVTSEDLLIEAGGRLDLYEHALSGCIRYRLTDALMRRDPPSYTALSVLGAALGDGGWYHITIDGTLAAPRLKGAACSPRAAGHARRARPRTRLGS
jgi:type II secretion system protein N